MRVAVSVAFLASMLSVQMAHADCAIVGDSIAVMVGPELGMCLIEAQRGVPSGRIIQFVQPADVLIVSAGSNDPTNPRLEGNLRAIRGEASGRVIWILPVNQIAALAVRRVAALYRDPVISFEPGSDQIHPKSVDGLATTLNAYLKLQH